MTERLLYCSECGKQVTGIVGDWHIAAGSGVWWKIPYVCGKLQETKPDIEARKVKRKKKGKRK